MKTSEKCSRWAWTVLQNDTYRDILCKSNYTWVASFLLSARADTEWREMVRRTGVCEDREAGDLPHTHCQQGVKSELPVKMYGSTVWYKKNKLVSCVNTSQRRSKTNVLHTHESGRPRCTVKYHAIIHSSWFSQWKLTEVLTRTARQQQILGQCSSVRCFSSITNILL
jgi:hypothetical protein